MCLSIEDKTSGQRNIVTICVCDDAIASLLWQIDNVEIKSKHILHLICMFSHWYRLRGCRQFRRIAAPELVLIVETSPNIPSLRAVVVCLEGVYWQF